MSVIKNNAVVIVVTTVIIIIITTRWVKEMRAIFSSTFLRKRKEGNLRMK